MSSDRKSKSKVVMVEISPPPTPKPSGDEKLPPTVLADSSLSAARLALSRRKYHRGKGSAPAEFSVRTTSRVFASSTSGSAYSTVLALQPNAATGVSEATQWAQLFDEVKCKALTVYCRVSGAVSSTHGTPAWAVAYDVGNSSSYPGVAQILMSTQHIGPIALNQLAGDSQTQSVNSTGYHKFNIRVPPCMPTTGAPVASETVGNGWFSCTDTAAVVGWLKPFVEAEVGQVVTLDYMIVFHMVYRQRT
jgi:hypothetical protein